jgi:transcription-repair coupling factor (superfamily II helicase)
VHTVFSLPQTLPKKAVFGQLQGCSLSIALAEFCQQTSTPKLIITEDYASAYQLQTELSFFLNHQQTILFFPDWETLPYDHFSPHQDIISERLSTLNTLVQNPKNQIVIATTSTLLHRLCPKSFLKQHVLQLKEGQTLHPEQFRNELIDAGYRAVNQVLEHGEFAVRGGIMDLFPMGHHHPFRIECFDNQIESLRRFDTDTQRTVEKISQIDILPAREFPLNETSIAQFRKMFREEFTGNPSACDIYSSVSEGHYPSGIEYYLPLFFLNTASIFDFLPEDTMLCRIGDIGAEAERFYKEVKTRFDEYGHDRSRPLLSPEKIFITPDSFLQTLNGYTQVQFLHTATEKKGAFHFNTASPISLPVLRNHKEPFQNLKEHIKIPNQRFLFCVESSGRREVFLELLKPSGIEPKVHASWQDFLSQNDKFNLLISPLSQGTELLDAKISIMVESQFFGESRVVQQRQRQKGTDQNAIFRDLAELTVGSPVVHIDFGVGRYQGLQTFEHDGISNEFLVLTYAGDDKVYVPVTSLHCISRYTGSDHEHAPLHRLGTDQWEKEKKAAREKIHDVAVELLSLYAARAAIQGFSYQCDEKEYLRFVEAFPFEETADQKQAIEAILSDMASSKPMDRLICGDVGFGKTEVAMRAAFVAVQNHKQVCVLVPTTLLAAQHFETFKDRFADFPIKIELLSRFRNTQETAEVLKGLRSGQVDIVIGTHKLFQKDIEFLRLGLLIVDEEHRFGVKQKEHINTLRAHVDLLSMTATPIPRTLNMAMAGIRDISLIATPPAKRLSVKTFWQERNQPLIREAILREILRGGQVFFLHNDVKTILKTTEEIQSLMPEAHVRFAHGQMRERDLERIMSDFYHRRFNVLVCTTIIETGIDIPTANTIIMDRADQLGLAQLHQLRGRVGRSHHQAYAYLLTPHEKFLTEDAKKRLEAIVALEDLGAGFTLATHDLEIRGAGDLLGEEQSGNMHAIGFTLFMEMLDKAVQDLKSGKIPDLNNPMRHGTDIDLQLPAIIPENYVADVRTRLILYKRINNAPDKTQLRELQVEFIDRFGLPPSPVQYLFKVAELKLLSATLGVTSIRASEKEALITFSEKPTINAAALIRLIQLQSTRYQMQGPQRLKMMFDHPEHEKRIDAIQHLLIQLKE